MGCRVRCPVPVSGARTPNFGINDPKPFNRPSHHHPYSTVNHLSTKFPYVISNSSYKYHSDCNRTGKTEPISIKYWLHFLVDHYTLERLTQIKREGKKKNKKSFQDSWYRLHSFTLTYDISLYPCTIINDL